ncbi:type II CAAX prenyl endopeptidase Rce1 family protein [Saccharopolyspora spinosporotrichia]
MEHPRRDEPGGEPSGFPVARLPGDPLPEGQGTTPQQPPPALRTPCRSSPRGLVAPPAAPDADGPSWATYSAPMRGADDSADPALHPRFWEAQLEAARRGSLAWGFAAFFVGYGAFYLAGQVVSAVMPSRESGFDPADPPALGPLLLLVFVPNLLLGLVPAIFSWVRGNGVRADFGIVPRLRDVKVGLACGGVALLLSFVLGLIMVAINGQPPETGISRLMQGEKSVWLFLFALFAFLGAPLTEELLMRGALWGALEHYRVPRYAILLLTTLIFAFIHQEVWRTPVLFVGGLAMGAARMITGRTGASVIAHATNNFLPALLLFAAAG